MPSFHPELPGVEQILPDNVGAGADSHNGIQIGLRQPCSQNGIFLALCSYVIFFVIGLTCMKPYFYAQTSDPDIALQGIRYLRVCSVFSLGLFLQTMGEKLLAATGRTNLSMTSQLIGAVVNIVLDPIFIFGSCGEALSGTTGCAPSRSRKNRRVHPLAHSGSCLVSAVARRGALPAEDPVIQILIHGASPPV